MVGSAMLRALREKECTTVLAPTHAELDLTLAHSVDAFFEAHRPNLVFLIGAKVGGIAANIADPVGFLADNVRMAVNALEACEKYAVRRTMFLGSSCMYPREAPQPMKEEYLMTGPLEPTNEGYALAKIVGLRLAQAYRHRGMDVMCPIPSNVYGTGDHFEFGRAHVLSSLVRRFVDAKESNATQVAVWGTGTARREFLHVDDLVGAMLFLFESETAPDLINVGTGKDISIRELATMIAEETGFGGEVRWDASKPDGMPRKCLDVTRLSALGYEAKISLQDGVRRTIAEYRAMRTERAVE